MLGASAIAAECTNWNQSLQDFDEGVLGKDLKAILSMFIKDTCDTPNVQRLGQVNYTLCVALITKNTSCDSI